MNRTPLPALPRGVTLLELLIVVTVMGVAAALVAPMFVPPRGKPGMDAEAVVTRARALAIARAEAAHVRIRLDGGWTVETLHDRALIDSGHMSGPNVAQEFTINAVGACMPTGTGVAAAAFDPLTCVALTAGTSP